MPALRACLVTAALVLTPLPGPGSWAWAEDTLPVPPRPAPPADAPVPVTPPAAGEASPDAPPKAPEPDAPLVPGPIIYDARSPFVIPTESVKDAHWASSITGPRIWAPAPPTPPRWSKPFVRPEPEPETEPEVEPALAPEPEPQPAVRPAPDADLPAEPVAPMPAPGPTGRRWSSPLDPATAKAGAEVAAKRVAPPVRVPLPKDPYWASTITAPRPTTRVQPGPIRRTPGVGSMPGGSARVPVRGSAVSPADARRPAGPLRVPPRPPPPPLPAR